MFRKQWKMPFSYQFINFVVVSKHVKQHSGKISFVKQHFKSIITKNMKKAFLISVIVAVPAALMSQNAIISFNTARTLGDIDPNIYGVFMEPIEFHGRTASSAVVGGHNTLYGTLYDPTSKLANKDGFRTDYIDGMKELKVTNMRWPGGNYVASYDWRDGIGPKASRPVRKDYAWGAVDNNHVGTDEWIALNKSIGTANYVCVNLGLGDIMNACHWLEYCNSDDGTYFAELRKKYGHPQPYHVQYWGLGNEVDGSPWIMGHKDADEYCHVATETAKAFKKIDKDIKLVASGSAYYEKTGIWLDWNRKVITALTGLADYLSIHRYWEATGTGYYDYVGEGQMDIEFKIQTVQSQVNVTKALYPDKKPMMLAVDEWAPFGQTPRSVLAVAMNLNSYVRHADFVKLANFTTLTSLLANDREHGTYKTPLFYTFKLFSTRCLGRSVDTYVQCDTFTTKAYKAIPYLDATTVCGTDGKVYVNVVNRHQDSAITADVECQNGRLESAGEADVVSFNLDDKFSYDQKDSYAPQVNNVNTDGKKLTFTFPAHSFTQLVLTVK
jgi:alpha-N-arabinofuranosidase